MNKQKSVNTQRQRRRFRVRNHLRGTSTRPRLSVFRSHRNVSCQIIDDAAGVTLAAASTQESELRGELKSGGNKTAAKVIGKVIAERALAKGITAVAFDRGGYRYHGRVASLADAAREAGLKF